MEIPVLVAEVRTLLDAGKSQDDALGHLRTKGCSKGQSVVIMASALNCGMNEAKRIVHFSNTWEDRRKSDEDLHDQILRDIEDPGAERS